MNKFLLENNYLVITNFIDENRSLELYKDYLFYCENSNTCGDPQVPGSKSVLNYLPFVEILCEKTQEISYILEETVLPTYSYSRIYYNGNILERHRDRDACEISLTLHLGGDEPWPIFIKTPKNVNIMTINPPNYILPNITVLNGVVEADNLRGNFTFNIKLQIPHITTTLKKGMPITGLIPIPRYFSDGFVLKDASDIFTAEQVSEELQANAEHQKLRFDANSKSNQEKKYTPDRLYMRGLDIYENKFPDHQV